MAGRNRIEEVLNTRLSRRDATKVALAGLGALAADRAASLVGIKPAKAEEVDPHWADKFVWVTEKGIPDEAHITKVTPDGEKLGLFNALIEPGRTGIGVFSQFSYDAADPASPTEAKLFIKGREGHPVVVIAGGKQNETISHFFNDMPINGGWFGVIENPSGKELSRAELEEAMEVRIERLRDPKLNNCTPGVGCKGPIEYVIIDGNGQIAGHGFRRN